MNVEILGERKTGTNYTRKMVQTNTKLNLVKHGWKHRLVKPKEEKDILYIVCVRHPLEWLQSLHHLPHHFLYAKGLPFSEFLKTKSKDYTGETYPNPIVMWNEKYAAYIELAEKFNVGFYRHEDVKANNRKAFKKIMSDIGNPVKAVRPINKRVSDLGMSRHLFKPRKYSPIKKKDIAFIMQTIDNKVLNYYYK